MAWLGEYFRQQNGGGPKKAVSPRRTATGIGVMLGLIIVMVVIAAHAPSTTYAFAQLNNIGSAMAMEQSGNWLSPMNQVGNMPRKGPLFYWTLGGLLKLTDARDDLVFRLPNVLFSIATAVLIYLLSCRWYNRRAALLAGCLWVVLLHMSKQINVALTDMPLTFTLTGAIFCLDRLAFHRAGVKHPGWWAAGFWTCMILGGITKGWGLVSLALVFFFMILAAGFGGGFKPLRRAMPWFDRPILGARIFFRRCWLAILSVRPAWGLPVFVVIVGATLGAMIWNGGHEFIRDALGVEIGQRITGDTAEAPPRGWGFPPLQLIYFTLPASALAILSLLLVRPGLWFSRRGPLCLPIFWIIAVVVPFSIPHGFRPDYLLPCYAAVAIMGGWAIDRVAELARLTDRSRQDGRAGKIVRFARHAVAAVPVLAGAAVLILACLYFFHEKLPQSWQLDKRMPMPFYMAPSTWPMLWACMLLGAGTIAVGVWASLAWRIHTVGAAGIVGMLGVAFLATHFINPEARSGDGEKMRSLAIAARPIITTEKYYVDMCEKLSVELYLGRFGEKLLPKGVADPSLRPAGQSAAFELAVRDPSIHWLITCDRGLVEMGAAVENPAGDFKSKKKVANGVYENAIYQTHPESLGAVRLTSPPVVSQGWGRIYLIQLAPGPIRLPAGPLDTGFIPGASE